MSQRNLPVEKAREDFTALVREVNDKFEKFVITNDGKPKAVLMSYEEYECWLETLEVFSEDKSAVVR